MRAIRQALPSLYISFYVMTYQWYILFSIVSVGLWVQIHELISEYKHVKQMKPKVKKLTLLVPRPQDTYA
jgi:hypothetical protein